MMAAQGLALRAVSRFWRTPAHPAGSGPDYVNAAALVAAEAEPEAILALLHGIEAHLGRTRAGGRWAARGIDLDLLAVGSAVLPDTAMQDRWRSLAAAAQAQVAPEGLILPHPRLQDRGFVLLPLAEIAPGTGDRSGQLSVLIPSFMLSEIQRAFEIGFLIALPFLIIDLVVSAVLMSMGMMMVPPTVVALPFKLAFFVAVDGWGLIAAALVRGYQGGG